MTQWVNVGGTWRKVVGEYTRVAGVWRISAASFVNVSGTNRFYSTVPTLQFLTSVEDTVDRSSYTFNNISLGTEYPNRRIFAFVATDYRPSGTLNLTATWNVGGTNYTNTIVSAALSPGFPITPDFSYYTGRFVSYLSDVIPTGTIGNFSIIISSDGALAAGVSIGFFYMTDIASTSALSVSAGTSSTYTLTNLQPGSIVYAFSNNFASSFPTITPQTLTEVGTDTYARSPGSSTIYSRLYGFKHNGTNILSSETLTHSGSSPSSSNRFYVIRYR